MHKTEIVVGLVFPPRSDSAPSLEPGKQPLDLPAALVASQFSTVLRSPTVASRRRNKVYSSLFKQPRLQRAAVPSFVADYSWRKFFHKSIVESSLGEHTVVSASARNMNSERKTIAVCKRHEFRRVPSPAFPDAGPPFFAGT